jgi:hypothetical protein
VFDFGHAFGMEPVGRYERYSLRFELAKVIFIRVPLKDNPGIIYAGVRKRR